MESEKSWQRKRIQSLLNVEKNKHTKPIQIFEHIQQTIQIDENENEANSSLG